MRITVVGSINLDLVASAPQLPRAGETVTGATLARHPGGKGANQALAARRLGADVCLVGRVDCDQGHPGRRRRIDLHPRQRDAADVQQGRGFTGHGVVPDPSD